MYRLILLGFLCFFATDLARAQETMPLVIGEPVERNLAAEEAHSFTLDLGAGQFVYGFIEQASVDVVEKVYGPEGDLLDTFDITARGPEAFQFRTEVAGTYRIEITPFRAEEGRYIIQVQQAEPIATTPEGKVDQLMVAYGDNTPGGVVAVTRGGDIVFARGYGMANLEYGIPNTPDTPYHMASVSKQFTAYAIVLLAQEGKLSLDDDVHKHLPELPDFGETITLRHLLNHTSGLRDQWNLWVMSGGRMDDVIRQEDLFRLILRQQELNFTPGEAYLYSNTGYMLLAETVARVSGKDFGPWMQEHVFEPLDMNDTQIYDDHQRVVKGRAYSYNYGEQGLRKEVLSYANSGATSLFTTANDLAKWLANMRTGQLGGPAVWEQMQERGVLNKGDTLSYALGVGVGRYHGLRRIQHGGADAGYRTMLAYYPEIDAGVIVLSNLGSFNTGRVANEVADAFFADDLTFRKAHATEKPVTEGVIVSGERLEAYTGEYAIEGGPVVTISRDGDRLFGQVEGQPQVGLVALSDTLFQVEVPGENIKVSFHRAADGTVKGGLLHQNSTLPFWRVAPWNPDVMALADYTGRYYSPELETYYRITVEDSALVAQHRRHGTIKLTVKEKDAFTSTAWYIGDVLFERDMDGEISGMRVSNGRVLNLRFEKVEAQP